MFPVETIPAQYYEERSAALEAAKRVAQQQEKAAAQAQTCATSATPNSSAPSSSTAHTVPQRPELLRPAASNGLLGSIFQGLVRKTSSTGTNTPIGTPPRVQTPGSSAEQHKAEMEKLMKLAEMKRDTDICALPGWH